MDRLIEQICRIEAMLAHIIERRRIMTITVQQILDDVANESAVIDSVSTLLAGLKAQVTAALASTNVAPASQAQLDEIFAAVDANRQKLAAAVVANTPASAADAPSAAATPVSGPAAASAAGTPVPTAPAAVEATP